MKFKTGKQETQFQNLHLKAQIIAYALDGFMQDEFGVHLIIISVYRANSDIHKNWLGFDFRYNLTKSQWDITVAWCNKMFKYSDGKLTIVDERVRPEGSKNWSGKHGHAQINWRNGEQWV